MKTILVVDDNPANIGLLFDCLNQEGYKTLVAQDGKSAVEVACRLIPDLILLDVIMPDMDGFDTCMALKQNPDTAEIPVFFMTALTDTESKVKGFECGAVDFISKPFQQKEVLVRISAHLTIQEQRKGLILANRFKEKVISVVAHDLRNPFTAIFAYLQMLTERYDRYDDEKRKAYISRIKDANQDLFGLVESLLSWITTGDGKIEYCPENVCLKDLVTTASESAQALAEKKSINLEIDLDDGVIARADKNMLAAVVRNLLTNALKFTPMSGVVRVGGEVSGNTVILRVEDSGVGMTQDQINHILSGKNRHTTKGTEGESGTGMGLIICMEFISMMDGSLRVDSSPHKGCTFEVKLKTGHAIP